MRASWNKITISLSGIHWCIGESGDVFDDDEFASSCIQIDGPLRIDSCCFVFGASLGVMANGKVATFTLDQYVLRTRAASDFWLCKI